jgi:hypothetical protein
VRLVAVTRVLNEEDIVEPLARHHAALVDHHIVLDNGSVDRTVDILLALRAEGVKLTVLQNDSVFFSETQYNTFLYDLAVASYAADWVVFLDGDEFIGGGDAARLRDVLAGMPADQPSLGVQLIDYQAPTPATRDAVNVLERFVRRVRAPADNWKVFVRGGFAPGRVTVDAGNHHIFLDGVQLAPYRQSDIWLAHYPSRSPPHMGAKAATGRLKVLAAGQRELGRQRAVHYTGIFERLKTDPRAWCRGATAQFERLMLWAGLEDDPFRYLGAPLTHTRLPDYGWRAIGLMLANMEKLATAHGNLLDRHPAVRDQVDDELATVRVLAGPDFLPAHFAPPATRSGQATRLLRYGCASLAEFAAEPAPAGQAAVVEALAWQPAVSLEVPPVAFGAADLSRPDLVFLPPGDPGAARLHHPATPCYLLRGADLHGNGGVVTLGDRAVLETLPIDLALGKVVRPPSVTLADRPTVANLHSAWHLLLHNVGNYYHWLMDGMVRFQAARYTAFATDPGTAGCPNLLLPTLDRFWKWESLGLMTPNSVPRLPLSPDARVFVERLLYVPDLGGGTFQPHPAVLAAMDGMRDTVLGGPPTGRPWRRVFVSRGDSNNRELVNEAELAARAEAAGFIVVRLSELSVGEQVRLFAETSHIIAPHGAGLVNIGFCQPGAVLCELHMDAYVHWAFRRLAALRGVRYGCLIGQTLGERRRDVNENRWRLDPAKLEALLADPAFLSS